MKYHEKIPDIAIFMNYYDKVNQVDWFYIVVVLMQIPVGLFALYFVDFIGLKKTFWISTSLNVIGTGLRLGGISKLIKVSRLPFSNPSWSL